MMDTIIFQHGHPFRWIFTSEKTGVMIFACIRYPSTHLHFIIQEVLKKKECRLTAGEIVNSLKKRAGRLRGKKIIHHERSKFASVWYRTDSGLMAFRLLDEAELYFILADRTYTQFISAIQVYFSGYPLKGCGIFEHHYVDTPRGASGPIHRTFEYVHMPQSIDIFDLNHQMGDNTGGVAMKESLLDTRHGLSASAPLVKQERLVITETQHDILKAQTIKIMKLVEKTVRCTVSKATFLFYFNTAWSPFVVACTKMQLASANAILPGPGIEIPVDATTQAGDAHKEKHSPERTSNTLHVDIERTDVHVVKAVDKKAASKKQLNRTSTEIYSTDEEWQVRRGINEEVAREEERPPPHKPPAPLPATGDGPFIPPPNASLPKSKIKYEDREARSGPAASAAHQDDMKQQILKSKFGGKRHSVLDNFIRVLPGRPGQGGASGSDKKKEGLSSQAVSGAPLQGRKGVQNDISEKRFMTPTDNNCVRVKFNADTVRRSDDTRWNFIRDGSSRRPISAPHASAAARRLPMLVFINIIVLCIVGISWLVVMISFRPIIYSPMWDSSQYPLLLTSSSVLCWYDTRDASTQLKLSGMQSYTLPKGKHGLAEGSARASGLQKRLPLAGQVCFGDYCNLLTPLAMTVDDTDDFLLSVNMMKVRELCA